MAELKNTVINDIEFLDLPTGTTNQRPGTAEQGMIRFNTTEGYVEGFDGSEWVPLFVRLKATGGTVTDITQDGQLFRVHTFTSDGTFEVTRGGEVEYLIVGGGGGGGGAGSNGGSGGGGGGVVKGLEAVSVGSFNVSVGFGGPRGDGTGNIGFNGGDSEFLGFVALGGGGGEGGGTPPGKDGGSGGGSRSSGDESTGLQPGTNPGAVLDAGNDGGAGPGSGGGGGGAGGPGGSGNGTGGPGLLIEFDGNARFFGSGGNGQFATETSGGQTTDQQEVIPNTGSGGAGTFSDTRVGNVGTGASGIVIVRYRIG